jgi:probable DNA metabolism protein
VTRYRYDGTPQGFLCALARVTARGDEQAEIESGRHAQVNMFGDDIAVASGSEEAARAAAWLEDLAGCELVRDVLLVLLSATPDAEAAILGYLRRLTALGGPNQLAIAEPAALRFISLQRAVLRELHRYLGQLRFEPLGDGVRWASLRPKANLAPLLAFHYATRMPGGRWLIADVGRGSGAWHEGGVLSSVTLSPAALRRIRQRERLTRSPDDTAGLWRAFCRTVSNPARRNPCRQRSLLPRALWRYLAQPAPSAPHRWHA